MGNTTCRRCRRSENDDCNIKDYDNDACSIKDQETAVKTCENNIDHQEFKKSNKAKLIKKNFILESDDLRKLPEKLGKADFDDIFLKEGTHCYVHQFYDQVIENTIDPKKKAAIIDSIKHLIQKQISNDNKNEEDEECKNENSFNSHEIEEERKAYDVPIDNKESIH